MPSTGEVYIAQRDSLVANNRTSGPPAPPPGSPDGADLGAQHHPDSGNEGDDELSLPDTQQTLADVLGPDVDYADLGADPSQPVADLDPEVLETLREMVGADAEPTGPFHGVHIDNPSTIASGRAAAARGSILNRTRPRQRHPRNHNHNHHHHRHLGLEREDLQRSSPRATYGRLPRPAPSSPRTATNGLRVTINFPRGQPLRFTHPSELSHEAVLALEREGFVMPRDGCTEAYVGRSAEEAARLLDGYYGAWR